MNTIKKTICITAFFCALAARAGKPVITSLSPSGVLAWTNAPGTNAFAIQQAPTAVGPWSNCPAPLDSIITTNSRTTVSVPINSGKGFFRLSQGFGPQSLRGAWMIYSPTNTNFGPVYFMADGLGLVTNFGGYNTLTPPGYYSVSNTGSVTMVIQSVHQTNMLTGQFAASNSVVFTGSPCLEAFAITNLALCAGNWSGTLVETSNPAGLNSYSISVAVGTNGSASFSSSSLETAGSGYMLSLAPTNGVLACFIKTGIPSSNYYNHEYNQISIQGTLAGNSLSGTFDTDSGSGTDAVGGTVTLNKQ